jgi:hypothetical protein
MKRSLFAALLIASAGTAHAQVDVAHRRTLTVQTGFSVADGEEQLGGFGYYWFNENHYPWDATALRVIFAGIFADAELSCFLPAATNIAVGVGGGGGLYIDGIVPYRQGERLSTQQFFGDNANLRVFINDELFQLPVGDMGAIPFNVRATYGVSGSFYREDTHTRDFTLPADFLTQTATAEIRFGGIEPGLLARRGFELYGALEANYRSGFRAFGPNSSLFPAHSTYQRAFGNVALKLPVGETTVFAKLSGGFGDDLDELSAYKLGGNLVSVEPFASTIYGYYTREIFAEDFGLVNLELRFPVADRWNLTGHLYGDFAQAHQLDGALREWHSYLGSGAGISFRAPWQTDVLLSYGYGFNAMRNGDRGGHEVGLALQREF